MTQLHHGPARTGRHRASSARRGANHPHTTNQTRGDLMTSNTPTAGGILNAAAALQDPNRDTFTRAEVAYLMRLAYDSGRTATYIEDIAELHATWARHPIHRPTAEQRYEQRLAEMGGRTCTYHGGPVDFETGRPVRHLEVAA